MKNISIRFNIACALLFIFATMAMSNSNPNLKKKSTAVFGTCAPGISSTELNINNVRATLLTGGDLWWDRQRGNYYVPLSEHSISTIFAGGIWMGGKTRAGNIKLAGITYASLTDNFDWYPGPLNEFGETDDEICHNWDRFFTVYGTEIDAHRLAYRSGSLDCNAIPDNIKYWPAKGNPYWNEKYEFPLPDQSMAAFWDENIDGIYDPCVGDYPMIFRRGCEDPDNYPDQFIFNCFNDMGGPHRLTGGDGMQMEVQANAFAYKANDEINNATFCVFKINNKANEDLIDFYTGLWVDPDLGCYADDYVGVDSSRSMLYIYNEDLIDGNYGSNCPGSSLTFGEDPPIMGISLIQGMRGPKVFVKDAAGNCIYNGSGEKLIMDPIPGTGDVDTLVLLNLTSFNLFKNLFVGNPDPTETDPMNSDNEFYNALMGLKRDGSPWINPVNGLITKFPYHDAPNDQNGWSMCTYPQGNNDYRVLLSCGPALLQPGASNLITYGLPFQRHMESVCPDIKLLQQINSLLEKKILDCIGHYDTPDAPDLYLVGKDKKINFVLSNANTSNNFEEKFIEIDQNFPGFEGLDPYYRFEGYKIFQLRDENVRISELYDNQKARLVHQSDLANGIKDIYNWNPSLNPIPEYQQDIIWLPDLKVEGNDLGTIYEFTITKDAFSTNIDQELVNGKTYYYMPVAYAVNNWASMNPYNGYGQRTPYMESRTNIRVYPVVPGTVSTADVDILVWHYKNIPEGISLYDLPKSSSIQMYDITGKLVVNMEKCDGQCQIKIDQLSNNGSIFLINVVDLDSGISASKKVFIHP